MIQGGRRGLVVLALTWQLGDPRCKSYAKPRDFFKFANFWEFATLGRWSAKFTK